MIDYFHRRNLPLLEYSGHEEVVPALRKRLTDTYDQYVKKTTQEGYFLRADQMLYRCRQQFPDQDPEDLIARGSYDRVFAVIEILHGYAQKLHEDRRASARSQLAEAFRLSGSVYALKSGQVTLIPSDTTAKQLKAIQPILSPYASCHQAFFGAVGDLMGRKRKPDDIVKDLFVGVEGYLKALTDQNDYGAAIKALRTAGALNVIQYAIMDKLYGYRSDAHGVGHAGNSPVPSETDALWFLETVLAQITNIDRKSKKRAA